MILCSFVYVFGSVATGVVRRWHDAGALRWPLDQTLTAFATSTVAHSPSVVSPLESGTLSLSPQDTYLSLDKKTHASAKILAIQTWPDHQVAKAILMKFDLSALPAGAVVTNATLRLALVHSDKSAATTYNVAAYRVIGRNPIIARATGYTADGATAWTPNRCCDQDVPLAQADIAAASSDTQAIDQTPGFKSWTITDMVQDWLTQPAGNFGLLLNADATAAANHYRNFASTRYGDASLRPRLTVAFVAPDATPPSVTIGTPGFGHLVSGPVWVMASATDNVGVAGVQFQVNGTPLGPELTAAPYALNWDTTTVSDGSCTLTAVARDAAGNQRTSAAVRVLVKNGILLLTPQDTFLNVDRTSYARSTFLGTYTWPDHQVANAILMKFDLSTLPHGTVVQQARIFLALIDSDKTRDGRYTVTANKVLGKDPVIPNATGYTADGKTRWTPISCCYNGVPLAQADISPAYDTQAIGKTPGFKSWTITPMVQEWVNDPRTNFGVLLNSDASTLRDRYRFFASTGYSNPHLRPVLRVQYAVGDVKPPSVSITAPAAGAAVSGTVTVAARATDNLRVAGVQFKLDGADLGAEDTTSPYSILWDTTKTADGTHRLTAVARDSAGNRTTTGTVTVRVENHPSADRGIASRYPGDVGIENDPDVVFVEKFRETTLSDLFNRWTDVRNGAAMLLGTDVPPGSRLARSLEIPWVGGGANNGGHLYKVLSPGINDRLYVRYYIKYPTKGTPHHSGIWMGGYNPPSAWPDPQSGAKPTGNDRFIAAAEQNVAIGSFDHYDYWMGMHQSTDGPYWGNFLLNNPSIQARRGQWTCVEHMVKLNNSTTASNGEHAIWLDGIEVSHLGPGFPHGSWSGGIFTQRPSGSPFAGFQWRSDPNLNINWIWLENYSPDDPAGFTSTLKFAHVVAARSYIGCLVSTSSTGGGV